MHILAGILIPPLADVTEVVTVVLFILYGIYQLIAGKGEADKKAPQPRNPRPPRPAEAPGRAAPNAPPNQADSLRREVEDFLRRAQGQPPEQEEFAPLTPVAESEQRLPERSVAQQRPSRSRPPRQRPPRQRAPRQPNTLTPDMRTESVAEHVSRHVRSTKIAEHAEHLGDEVGHADERMESRLHEKFDHQVGSLRQQTTSSDTAQQKNTVADEIAELLKKPEGMRQLIIAQEILQRPNRW